MKIHHLDCATLCAGAGRWVTGKSPQSSPSRLVCHCLLIETGHGLVLVESGIGHHDMAHPRTRLGRFFLRAAQPELDPSQTALAQVEGLGFTSADVRHVILTHAHVDHAGGIADFPGATVHLYAAELRAVKSLPSWHERLIYRPIQWSHNPLWKAHELEGERWYGFEAVRVLPDLDAEILLVPLPGHTRGHAAVAVRDASGWLLHAGDAYFHRQQLASEPGSLPPPALAWFERAMDLDVAQRESNLSRLKELKRHHGSTVTIFCAHDAVEFDDLRAKRGTRSSSELREGRRASGSAE